MFAKKYIPRDGYLKKITPFIGTDLIKVLTGQRRVGKSYLIYQIIDEIRLVDKTANIISINMELNDFEWIKDHHDLITYVASRLSADAHNYLFIDEVQEIMSFEKALRHFQSAGIAEVFCTGSNADLLSGELATLLSGRYIEFHVSGLSYTEFLRFQDIDNTNDSLNRYIKYGSLPYLCHLPNDEGVIYEYLRSVYNTILYKDIVSRFSIRNTVLLENLLRFLMDNIGNIFSAKKISDYLKSQQINLSPKVIINYINHFEKAFLIYGVKRYGISGKKIFEVGEKYFFEDLGIRHAIGGYRNADMGKIMENLVFKHLQRNSYQVMVGSIGAQEVDFVGKKDNNTIYIQVAYKIYNEKTHEREFGNLLRINDNFRKIVVTYDDYIEGAYQGIEHIHIREFLSMDEI